ncbi:hypothetical protein HK098_007525 [Nowakowskiella sp. JEL0407]|nr:hypothetical protein HK098_007525 [Nowakowskiella sp. JEL0407]
MPGETELPSTTNKPNTRPTILNQRKYRHNKITQADPNSKRSERRSNAEARMTRKRIVDKKGKSGSDVGSVGGSGGVGGVGGAGLKKKGVRGPKSELKSRDQIVKERKIKQKRREKTGRHNLKKK